MFSTIWILLLITNILIWVYSGIKLHQYVGLFVFWVLLVLKRIILAIGRKIFKRRIPKIQIRKEPRPESIVGLLSAYLLKTTEVVLGYNSAGKPIRTDILDRHTMLGATTGGAKTSMLHAILIQLFGKGTQFSDNVDVYLADLKAHPADMLDLWQPVLTGYAKRQDNGDITDVIEMLKEIDNKLKQHLDKKLLVIIEEVSVLTQDKEGDRLLTVISSQLRLNGSLLLTVQHPHHKILATVTKHNIERRVCGVVVNNSQAETILEIKVKDDILPEKPGEYLIREPGFRGIRKMTSIEPDLPAEIEWAVAKVIEVESEVDYRIKLFVEVSKDKKAGDSIIGVQSLAESIGWLTNPQQRIMVAYRNYALAGCFNKPVKGGRYTMKVDYHTAYKRLKEYIKNGEWREEPNGN